jgi:hypothetical protein
MPKKEERGFRYQNRTKDDLKERANMKGGNFDTYIKGSFKQWKPKEGKNRIRILPPSWDDARHYGLDIYVNFNIGADNQSYLSLSKHGKGEDPLAEARREAQKDGDKALAKNLNPSQRILYWIIDRNDEDEGPLLWAAPFTFDKSLSNLCIDEDTKEVIFIDHPSKGRDVRFYREGTGLKTNYDPSKMKVLNPSPICEDEGLENEWLDFIEANPLPEVLNFYTADHIRAVFDGQAGREEDDDGDKPRSRRRAPKDEDEEKPASRTRKRAEPEDEDDPEEKPARSRRRAEPEDEEDPEEKPAPRRRARAEPEDEPEEKPARTRTRTKADPEDDPEEKPARSRRRAEPEEDPDEDEDPPSSRRGKTEKESSGGSLRDRIARGRSRSSDDD